MTSPGVPSETGPAASEPFASAPQRSADGAEAPSRSVGGEDSAGHGGEVRLKTSCVILTMGTRPAELRRAVTSVLEQEGADLELIVVSNGAELPPLPDGVITVMLDENIGIPKGRNAGVAAASGDIVLFLDDDGWYRSRDLVRHVSRRFESDPGLGIVTFRIVDPDGGPDQRRYVPRLRVGDPLRSSRVTTFLGGAAAVRRTAFDEAGGLPDGFFYAHEESDLAWRVLDAGYDIEYDAEAVMYHPSTHPSRHEDFYRLNARNRVWLVRRNLPWPLALAHLGVWISITVARERSLPELRAWFRGFREGWRGDCGPRSPMRWSTAWRMMRIGRPPVV
ncbi:glycosyltransferase family 2 protein [Streptomonospora salina]|uniref:GT2 family glycosyltransferase n=1 Tax=Streptomonospora salina TaxID=104205 RepID=A0A841EA92_9ACTN|nr:glycosyltransferase [Streptomonospora salina]MBB5999374.1 GT2 family glycosyltransferase [Streptomonospora salina]